MGRKPDLTPEQAEEVRLFYYDRAAKWTVAAQADHERVGGLCHRQDQRQRGAVAPGRGG